MKQRGDRVFDGPVRVGGAAVNAHSLAGTVDAVVSRSLAGGFGYVVTANTHHVDLLTSQADFRSAYDRAEIVTADGWPVAALASLLGRRKIARVAGSDLLPAVAAEAASRGLTIGLLGGSPGAALKAAANLQAQHPTLYVSFVEEAPAPWSLDSTFARLLADRVAAANLDILFVGFGAPKQEMFVARYGERLNCRVALCVGAGIDFAAGARRRAPGWMQRCGLEWAHRLAQEPRRLFRRYLTCTVTFARVARRELSGSTR